jgi:ArsR family transcriptional regulator, arsenate/arsenite/antimonite-responsive transcriptional repressor / arsenate reductase (thioredoxin)
MMMELPVAKRAAMHGALADPHRLEIVDELAMSDRSPSELSASLAIGSNLLAHHLGVLEEAGIVERLSSAGDARRRYVRLIPDAVSVMAEPVATLVARHVLFVCTANSARSQLAAAVWNARHEVPASSAGTRPAPSVRPEAIRAAARAGFDLHAATTRSIEEIATRPDLLVTVCDVAREELGSLPDYVRLLHWSIPDPALTPSASAFDQALRRISSRVDRLAPHIRPPRRPRRSRPRASRTRSPLSRASSAR